MYILYRNRCTSGADPGGRTRRAPPLKLGKNMIFWRKIVIFHTKYPKIFRVSLRSAQFFLSAPPLTWNPDPPLIWFTRFCQFVFCTHTLFVFILISPSFLFGSFYSVLVNCWFFLPFIIILIWLLISMIYQLLKFPADYFIIWLLSNLAMASQYYYIIVLSVIDTGFVSCKL